MRASKGWSSCLSVLVVLVTAAHLNSCGSGANNKHAMNAAKSKDGTTIGYHRGGSGPPLVLVHGTTADHHRWDGILPTLEKHFTVYAVDRRGRGLSGDTEPYAIEREFEDVAAVVESIDGPVYVLGHSYGALCSLESALRTDNIKRLILYEPPLGEPGSTIYPPGVIDTLETLLEKGDRAGVVTTFMQHVVRVPDHELAKLKSSPAWSGRVAAAHTIPRELSQHERYEFDPSRFSSVTVPTLLLLGSDSPPFFKAATERIAAALPNDTLVVLQGQQHVAMDMAPELFLSEVMKFLKD